MKKYTVYLYRDPDCIRGWLAYLKDSSSSRATLKVSVEAESGQKAKNKAITLVNLGLDNLEILKVNYDDKLWGLNNFPELGTGGRG